MTEQHRQVVSVLNMIRVEAWIASPAGGVGRPLEDRRAIASAFVAKAVYNMSTTRQLPDRLACDAVLRRICGWESRREIPHESQFSRAFAELLRPVGSPGRTYWRTSPKLSMLHGCSRSTRPRSRGFWREPRRWRIGSDFVFTCPSTPPCTPKPINVAGGNTVYLILFGTGFRNRSSLNNTSATLNGRTSAPLFAGAQGGFAGLDQLNVLIPSALAGAGLVDVSFTADGMRSNTVTIQVR